VVLFHILNQLTKRSDHLYVIQPQYELLMGLFARGDRGVPLFFAISGFILARPFLREYLSGGRPVVLGAYYLRRLTRLEPPYILSLLIYTAGLILYSHQSFSSLLPHLIASIFYAHSLTFRTMSTINFVAWSLEIEVQFYLLAPLLGKIYQLSNRMVRRSTMLALMAAGCLFHLYATGIWTWTLLYFAQYFLAGFLLADLMTDPPKVPARLWDVVSLLAWPAIFLIPGPESTLEWLPFLIVPAYMAAFYGPASNWFFRRPGVAIVGGMCYSLYLMHMFVIAIAFKATKHLAIFQDFLANYLTQVFTLGPCVLLFGTLYFILVERPCMDPEWPQKMWRRLRFKD
jgi:peptidoglycan/LPS O-acetylase OafA/YrhL